ncbi:hypothetical protein SAY87_022942 [Trapa incisa]|uniref:Eukaryotic translation initiation factor 4B3 n=1 Tax=Trapa incisa TaxID=236973 RepID=A0AAN7Q4Z0_9MYRT|nr:hypothetical protein SAY87_022942 [Trapa incisa]
MCSHNGKGYKLMRFFHRWIRFSLNLSRKFNPRNIKEQPLTPADPYLCFARTQFLHKAEKRERERERMAAVVSPWAKPGAWAIESEENEADLLPQQKPAPEEDVSAVDFPSLSAAAATKPKKKKKGQTFSLADFTASASVPSKTVGLTHEDLLVLPTGPRERSAEELDRNRLGGGFRSYGSGRYGDDSSNSRRGGGFDESRSREPLPPSRADETDDWGAGKKPIGNGFERRERSGGFFGSQSKADESDNWGSNKNSEPMRFINGVGGDFARERRGFRGGYEAIGNGSGADSDRWGKKREDDGLSNASRVDSDRWGRRKDEENSLRDSSARPKLVLQPRTLPVDEASGAGLVKPKGANPFGDARPREEVLKEKGQDWKEIDEKLESLRVKEGERGEKHEGSPWKRGGFGRGSSRASSEEDKTERNWRKNDSDAIEATVAPPSDCENENA